MTKEQTFEHPPRGHVALLAYDSVNDRFQVVHVDANGLLQVDVAAVADPQANAHGYDGAAWRKQPLIFGYTDTLRIRVVEANATAGTNTLESSAVPAGEIWIVGLVRGWNANSVSSSTNIGIVSVGTNYPLDDKTSPAAGSDARFAGSLTMKEGDKLRFTSWGTTLNDDLYLIGLGTKMSIDM